jgi:hypothetical protein
LQIGMAITLGFHLLPDEAVMDALEAPDARLERGWLRARVASVDVFEQPGAIALECLLAGLRQGLAVQVQQLVDGPFGASTIAVLQIVRAWT